MNYLLIGSGKCCRWTRRSMLHLYAVKWRKWQKSWMPTYRRKSRRLKVVHGIGHVCLTRISQSWSVSLEATSRHAKENVRKDRLSRPSLEKVCPKELKARRLHLLMMMASPDSVCLKCERLRKLNPINRYRFFRMGDAMSGNSPFTCNQMASIFSTGSILRCV